MFQNITCMFLLNTVWKNTYVGHMLRMICNTHLICLYLSWHDTVSFDALRLSKMLRPVKNVTESKLKYQFYLEIKTDVPPRPRFDWPCYILIDFVLRRLKKIFTQAIKRSLNKNSCIIVIMHNPIRHLKI